MSRPALRTRVLGAAVLALALAGCRSDMQDQPRYDPLSSSSFFRDGRSSRPQVPGTIARGHLGDDDFLDTGKVDGAFVTSFPFPVTADVLRRGHERYDIYCSPCHDRTGSGNGMIAQRGYKHPPSFHIDRLRDMPPGYFFSVATGGFATMPGYATQVPIPDRWAIVAYIRALQLSQHATLADVPPADRDALEHPEKAAPAPDAPAGHGGGHDGGGHGEGHGGGDA